MQSHGWFCQKIPPLTDIVVAFTAHTIAANRYSTTCSVPLLAFPTPIILSEQLYLTRGVKTNWRSQHFRRFQMQWEMMRVERGRGMGPLALVWSQDKGRKDRDRICPWPLLWIFCGVWEADHHWRPPLLSSKKNQQKTELLLSTRLFTLANSQPLFNPYSTLIQPLFNPYSTLRELLAN